MACTKSRTDTAEELSFSVSFTQSQAEDGSGSWKKGLRNGQVLLVLTAHQACSSNPFDINLWSDRLKNLGTEMTPDQWKHLIQRAVLEPEVRSYLFYNSRAFGITITVILYVTLWVNLYFTLMAFSVGPSWETSIMATVIALVAAVAVRLIIHRCQSKMNMNTDMRLAAANEIFMEQEFLVGFTDLQDKHRNIPQLWFVHYKVEPCLQSLTDTVANMKRNQELFITIRLTGLRSDRRHRHGRVHLEQQSAKDLVAPPRPMSTLKHNLDKLCLVMETPVISALENKPESSLEETPLLSERRSSTRGVLTFRELLRLIPDGAPEEMAQHLLTIFSSYYVRLLVSGQLPWVPSGWHVELAHAPCLCQFIETKVLGRRS